MPGRIRKAKGRVSPAPGELMRSADSRLSGYRPAARRLDVVTDVDPPRLLHRRAGHGYTDRPALALRDEPEAVSEREQERITLGARRAETQRRHAAVNEATAAIGAALDGLLATVGHDRQIAGRARLVRRSVEALGRAVASPANPPGY